MDKLLINGGKKLSGEIEISTSKNAYLPILAACILCDDIIVLHKNPRYLDIYNMCAILENLGAIVEFENDDIIINSKTINKYEIPQSLASAIRSSIFSLGSILSRFKMAKVAFPGGCEIGSRPIDMHLKGLNTLGVKIVDRHGYLFCDGSNMHGGVIHLDFPSVGATENLILAAVLSNGKTEIFNAAKEPEIVDLERFLNKMGAKIRGAGTSHIIIQGVKKLTGVEYTPISDRIILGTYILGTLMCGGKVNFKNAIPLHVAGLLSKIDNSACKVSYKGDNILMVCNGFVPCVQKIETMPYPGFPTDLQAQIMASQSICNGTTVIVENLFESRFKQVPELVKMGAKITVKDRTAIVNGTQKLYGANVSAHDLRGGAALVIAGLSAEGYTTIDNIHMIDRGYLNIEKDFEKLGADIKRVSE